MAALSSVHTQSSQKAGSIILASPALAPLADISAGLSAIELGSPSDASVTISAIADDKAQKVVLTALTKKAESSKRGLVSEHIEKVQGVMRSSLRADCSSVCIYGLIGQEKPIVREFILDPRLRELTLVDREAETLVAYQREYTSHPQAGKLKFQNAEFSDGAIKYINGRVFATEKLSLQERVDLAIRALGAIQHQYFPWELAPMAKTDICISNEMLSELGSELRSWLDKKFNEFHGIRLISYLIRLPAPDALAFIKKIESQEKIPPMWFGSLARALSNATDAMQTHIVKRLSQNAATIGLIETMVHQSGVRVVRPEGQTLECALEIIQKGGIESLKMNCTEKRSPETRSVLIDMRNAFLGTHTLRIMQNWTLIQDQVENAQIDPKTQTVQVPFAQFQMIGYIYASKGPSPKVVSKEEKAEGKKDSSG